MIMKSGLYFGQPICIACDAKCHKAWGINNRPRVYLEESPQVIRGHGHDVDRCPQDVADDFNYDNYAFLADDELPDAPMSSNGPDGLGTWEGGHGKPETPSQRLNKWCARECERHVIIDDVDGKIEDFELPDYSQRQYNISPDE
jgi:hypothetical protein